MLYSYIEIQTRASLLVFCSCIWCTTGLWLAKSCNLVKHFRRFTESRELSCKWQLTFLSQRSKRVTTRREKLMKKKVKEMLNIGTWNSNTQQSQMFLFSGISPSKLMTTKSLLSLVHQAVERLHWFPCLSASTIQQMAKSFIMVKTSMTLILRGTINLKSPLCHRSLCCSLKQSKTIFSMDLTPLNFPRRKSKKD